MVTSPSSVPVEDVLIVDHSSADSSQINPTFVDEPLSIIYPESATLLGFATTYYWHIISLDSDDEPLSVSNNPRKYSITALPPSKPSVIIISSMCSK